MHNHFLDKRRRHINLRTAKVGGVLPEHFAAAYPKFISLLEHYYEFMDSDGSSTEMLNHLFAARDINETELDLLSFIEDELLLGGSYFQGFANQNATPQEREAQLRAAANFSNIMFRSKGTRFAIEWFFRSFYGIDAEVVYPKENIFKVGDVNSRIGADSLRYLTNDELYQTFALLVRVGVPISQWKDLFKLFVHPAGMYLAGEVLLEDTVQSLVNTRMDDSAVSQRNTSSYSVGVLPSDLEDEGTLFKFTVTGTDVPNNTDALYYYVDHIDTSDSDFVAPPPSISSPLYFEVNDSSGTAVGKFSIPTRTDSDETEGVERFNVFVIDDEDRVKGQSLINLNDVISSYVITPSSATPSEGDIITFDVAGTNVPNNGNTTLYYYVTHGTTSDSDFTVAPPTSTTAQPFSLVNSNGSFSLRTMVDNVVDDNETFTVSLQTETSGGLAKGSVLITVSDTIPTFDLTVDNPVEGNDLIASLSVDSTTIGDTVNWNVTGAAASDSRLLSTSGSFTVTGVNDTYLLSNTTSLPTYQGPTAGTVSFTSDIGFTDNDAFNLLDQAPVYTITPSSLISTEGDSVSYEIGGTNIPDSDVHFYIDLGETTTADFVGTVPQSGSPDTITMSGGVSSPSPLLQFATNGDLDPETFTAVVETTTGTELATLDYTIAGNRVYQLSLDSDNLEIDESKAVQTVSFFTTDSDGTYYYWFQGTNVNSGDFVSGFAPVTAKQPFTVSTNYGTIFADLNQDLLREGTETYKVLVSKTAGGGALAESPTITILDTSIPTYTVNASDQVEGLSVPVVITVDRAQSEVVNAKITGPADLTNRLVVTEKTKTVSGSPDYLFFNTTSDSIGYGDLTGTVTLRLDSANGLFLASDTFVLSDEAAAYSLTADLANDSANEGDTINFTFDGTNITDGTYHYRTSNMYPVRTDQVVPQGTFFIYLEDTTNLAIGMESNTPDVPGTIVSVSPGSGVTMSSSVTFTNLPVGYDFHFTEAGNFDDFSQSYEATGSFGVSSNSGTFRVDVAEDSDTTNHLYTFGVYDSHVGSLLASRLVTINDTTVSDPVEISSKPSEVQTVTYNTSTTTTVRFESDGDIKSSRGLYETVNHHVGIWLNPTTGLPENSGNYRIRATKSNEDGFPVITGDFGTWLPLSSNRTWTVTVETNNYLASADFVFEIQEIANPSNSDSWSVTIRAIEEGSVS